VFEIETGLCVAGPCAGARLRAVPLRIARGYVMLADDIELCEPANLGR
jgi:nitrite reductase/ring-hydroxylating ferredoxin subunit